MVVVDGKLGPDLEVVGELNLRFGLWLVILRVEEREDFFVAGAV